MKLILFVTCLAPLVVLPAVTLNAGGRVNPAVDLVLAQVIATVGQKPLGRFFILVARLDLFLVGVAIGTKGFLVTGVAGEFILLCIVTVLLIKSGIIVLERCPIIGVTLGTVGRPLHLYRVHLGHAAGIGTGIEDTSHKRNYHYQEDFIFQGFAPPSEPNFFSNA
jgi:hypothetical protein